MLEKEINAERKQDKVMVEVLNSTREWVLKDLKRKQEDKENELE